MVNLGFVINFVIRVLSGERYRRATFAEKQSYALAINIIALMTLCGPFLDIASDTGSNAKLWLGVMACLVPSVFVSFWLVKRLSIGFVAVLSGVVILCAIALAYSTWLEPISASQSPML